MRTQPRGSGVTKSGNSPGRGGRNFEVGVIAEKAGDGGLALFRLKRADGVDQRSTGLEPWRGAIEQLPLQVRAIRE